MAQDRRHPTPEAIDAANVVEVSGQLRGIVPRPVIALTATVSMEIGTPAEGPAVTTVIAEYVRVGA